MRAAMVEHPALYRWSSYRTNAQGEASPFIKPHVFYKALNKAPEARQAAHRELFRDPLGLGLVDQLRSVTNDNYALGNERFLAEMAAVLGQRDTRPGWAATG